MKKVIFMLATLSSLSFAAVAGTPETTNKKDANAPVKAETTVQETGPAVYLYNGAPGQENDPSKYDLTPVDDPESLCEGGPKRCAATFQTDSNGHRTGNPTTPIYTKP